MNPTPTTQNNPLSDQAQSLQPQKQARFKSVISRWVHKNKQQNLRQSIVNLVDEENAHDQSPQHANAEELSPQEKLLISNILRLRGQTADDVMVQRADIFAIDDTISFEKALEVMRHENHSRVPVYHTELDNIIGMLHVKDLIAYTGKQEEFNIANHLRQPLFIAPQIPILDLLLQMRLHRIHLALVIDEFGSIDGLVTIEDLVETIVGDIADEHDDPDVEMILERDRNTLDLDARMPLEDLEKYIGVFLTEEEHNSDIDTIGGLVFRLAEHVPTKGEVLTHSCGLVFRVLDADPRHIRRLRMHIPNEWVFPGSTQTTDQNANKENG
ncbi:hemolysin family protein [Commensalibacter papalotli (ex Servin-Garciduenas et al. 2014)]|uniref:Hemolysin/magnesium/cobalt transporter HlyC n=1 Tax=Commensalibacter papalotli (ex Servin-Garciduenas et al. 2014) TaxID=1208583 RepID=W7DTW1_9PROT|nr:hemolysin family protein [Commensalibacter papalotli (ex Servin-Garciduenas et al. 2014)]EUK18445.1 hemolysin/magnesium/cobalt transporter HlyC [Commensalibacter papalotli (ex Servin-Garciduenas et al. 2014)]